MIRKSGNHLIIDTNGRKIPCPAETVNYIVKFGNSQISEQVLNFLAEKKIAVMRFSYGGRYGGTFLPPEHNIGKDRLLQYKAYFDAEERLRIAKEFIISSALNKVFILKKYKQKTDKIKELIQRIKNSKDIDSLRGIEGIVANIYFSGLKKCFKKFIFSGREYRPPKDEINALLSFGYACLYCDILNKIHEHGLCPFLGYMHEQNDDANALVYDLSECFKQEIDLMILDMVNHNEIKDEHFNKKIDGNCLLNTFGKNIFLRKFECWMRKTKKEGKDDFISNSERIRKEVVKLKHHLQQKQKFEGNKL